MKTLILTSSGQFITSNNIDKFLPKKIADCKIAYIITASLGKKDTGYVGRHREKMNELKWHYTEMDIAGKSESELRKKLAGCDIVFVEGGNTFYLLKAVRESGFENVIKDLISKGVTYIGSSAGSYIACPTIFMSTFSKEKNNRCGVTDLTAMNLIPFLIKAHFTPDMLPNLKEIRKIVNYPMYLLNDNQALLIRGEKVKLIGGGENIIL